ncbi:hypothetical protein LOTGIDRAFT_229597 [Lottia gigantea]|uniref:Claudin n=1 Tax=Lottia gigantea TaxID=225164 RepID=V3Z0R3_LOTGI|nr:hypothetical protein LOTGIDRAFT_229597 [Lottia gigantea]ESO84088.1 hypothetical protein LOTGIDRAFT_229597 [Lottia gigantea]
MNRLKDRPLGYKVGLFLYFVGLALFVLGYSIPSWHTKSISKRKFNDGYKNDDLEVIVYRSGLWLTCEDGLTDCDLYDVIPGWLNGVRFCMSMSSLVIGLALLCAILLNFTDALDNKNEIKKRTFEICCFIGVIFGLIGFILYATSVKSDNTGNHISWAYAVCCIGEIMIFASGLIVTVTHVKSDDTKTTSVSQWPYGMGTGLDRSFQQETQISGFPEIDNPAFTDPSQIRFTRTTATTGRPPSIHSSNQTLHGPNALANAYPIQQPEPGRVTRFQKRNEKDRYSLNDSMGNSTGQASDFNDAPPSYQSVISESSGRSVPRDQDLGDGQPYYNYQPHINNEVTL